MTIVTDITASPEVDHFVLRLQDCLHQSVEGVIKAGEVLIEARQVLGTYDEVGRNAGLSASTVSKLVSIAENPAIFRQSKGLPSSVEALYLLSRMEESELEGKIAEGVITPELTVRETRDMLSDPDEPDAKPDKDKPIPRFADHRDEIVFSVTASGKRLADALALLCSSGARLTVDLGQDILREVSKIDIARAELLAYLDEELGTLGLSVPTYAAPRSGGKVIDVPPGHIKAGNQEVSLGGVSDSMWASGKDTTITKEEWEELSK